MGPDAMRLLAVGPGGAWLVETPVLERKFTGPGDATTARFLARWLRSGDLADALEVTASATYSLLEATSAADQAELRLVAAQNDLVDPRFTFQAVRLDETQSSGT